MFIPICEQTDFDNNNTTDAYLLTTESARTAIRNTSMFDPTTMDFKSLPQRPKQVCTVVNDGTVLINGILHQLRFGDLILNTKSRDNDPNIYSVIPGTGYSLMNLPNVGDFKHSLQKNDHLNSLGTGVWLRADGRTLTSQYKALIELLGDNKLPDLSNKVLAMQGPGHASKTFTVAESNTQKVPVPEHNHPGSFNGNEITTSESGWHQHTVGDGKWSFWCIIPGNQKKHAGTGDSALSNTAVTDGGGGHTHTFKPSGAINIDNSGTKDASMTFSTLQPTYYTENIFIYCPL